MTQVHNAKQCYKTLVIFKKLLEMLRDNTKWHEAKNFLFDGINGVGKKTNHYLMQLVEQHFNCSNQERYYMSEEKFIRLPEWTGAIIQDIENKELRLDHWLISSLAVI